VGTNLNSWERNLFRGNEFKFVGTKFISWERIQIGGNEFLFRGNEFYFVGTNFNSWDCVFKTIFIFKAVTNLDPQNYIRAVSQKGLCHFGRIFKKKNYRNESLFRGNEFKFMGTNFKK
jgi:hypothetical protein